LGFVAGGMGALCGVGGGILIIPALKQMTTLSQHVISGTSLFSVTLAATVGAASYASFGAANLPVALCLSSTSILTAGLGVKAGKMMSDRSLTRVVGFSLLVAAPLIAFKHMLRSDRSSDQEEEARALETHKQQQIRAEAPQGSMAAVLRDLSVYSSVPFPETSSEMKAFLQGNWNFLAAGCAVGFTSGLLGLGGAIVMTTYMALGTDMSQHDVVATSLVAMVPTGLSASFFHIRAGNVKLRAAGMLAAGCASGMFVTSQFVTMQLDQQQLRYIFAAMLAGSSVKMILA